MSDDAKRFRDRASKCRAIAKGIQQEHDRSLLEEIAEELDAEADLIEARERTPD
jgi:hypothetical protein